MKTTFPPRVHLLITNMGMTAISVQDIYLIARVAFDRRRVFDGATLQGKVSLPFLLDGSTTANWKVDIRCGLADHDSQEVGLDKGGRLPRGFRLVVHLGNGTIVRVKHLRT